LDVVHKASPLCRRLINLHKVEDLALEGNGGVTTAETVQEALINGGAGRRYRVRDRSQRCPLVRRQVERFVDLGVVCTTILAAARNIKLSVDGSTTGRVPARGIGG